MPDFLALCWRAVHGRQVRPPRPRVYGALACALGLLGCEAKPAIVGVFDAGQGSTAAPAANLDTGVARIDAASTIADADLPSDASDGSAGSPSLDPCLDRQAARTFRRALCTCGDVTVATGGLVTDAFDSTLGMYRSETAQSSDSDVGVNGSLGATAVFTDVIAIGGDLIVGSSLGTAFDRTWTDLPVLQIHGDLWIGGTLSYTNSVTIDKNAWLAGDLQGAGPLHVLGDLTQSADAARTASVPIMVDGRDLRAPVAFAPPCPCGREEILDIAALVMHAEEDNDNQAAGFDREALAAVLALQNTELPPGRLFASGIDVAGTLTLVVNGSSALFVEG
ncbi:MAG TPA: hypothetical protein VG963_12470, partial [Polyangiaceae bacterium]|nr:hypothetical protein [Polyangiaceae bacterium]